MATSAKRVVVGDRDAVVLALISYILQRQGFSIESVTQREHLLEIIREGEFDAMVVDRDLDGVIDVVKAHPARASRIILTSPDGGENTLGVHALLKKPLEFGLLVDTVRDCTAQEP